MTKLDPEHLSFALSAIDTVIGNQPDYGFEAGDTVLTMLVEEAKKAGVDVSAYAYILEVLDPHREDVITDCVDHALDHADQGDYNLDDQDMIDTEIEAYESRFSTKLGPRERDAVAQRISSHAI